MKCIKHFNHRQVGATLLALSILGTSAIASPKAKVRELPPLLQKIQSKYVRNGTLMAEFSQVNKTAALNREKTNSGILMAKRPDKMRWETLKPDRNLLVSDGRTFWFYTPPFDEEERGQLIERKTSEVQSQLANALLSGNFDKLRSMSLKSLGGNRFRLTPKKGTAGTVTRAEIEIDPKEEVIRQVSLFHSDGNSSQIRLENIKLGETIEEGYFKFEAPPGTEKMKS